MLAAGTAAHAGAGGGVGVVGGGAVEAAGAVCMTSNELRKEGESCSQGGYPYLCEPELVCVGDTCVRAVPGLECERQSDCAPASVGASQGAGMPLVPMVCVPSNGRCGYVLAAGDSCTLSYQCASGFCEAGHCAPANGTSCDPGAVANPCPAGQFCAFDGPQRGSCADSQDTGGACMDMPAHNASASNVIDQCLVGNVCTAGRCRKAYSLSEGDSCAGVLGKVACSDSLACSTGGNAVCTSTSSCNATLPCAMHEFCECHSGRTTVGKCVGFESTDCDSEFANFASCLSDANCHGHTLFDYSAAISYMCAGQCREQFEEWHCCLAADFQEFVTPVTCPPRIKVALSVLFMISGAATGFLLGLLFGAYCARRRNKINQRYVALAQAIRREHDYQSLRQG